MQPTGQPLPMPPTMLAIDTSSAQGAVALYDGDTLSARTWPAGRSHTATLLCEVHHLLDTAGLTITQLAAIAITTGPGPFTGLRAGFGLAKGFHLAADLPLIGVPTLQVTALPFATCGKPVIATVAAGRGRLVWAAFESGAAGLLGITEPRNGTIDEFLAVVRESDRAVVTGEFDSELERMLEDLEIIAVPSRPLRVRQPGALAAIAWERWRRGDTDDPATLEPVYLSR